MCSKQRTVSQDKGYPVEVGANQVKGLIHEIRHLFSGRFRITPPLSSTYLDGKHNFLMPLSQMTSFMDELNAAFGDIDDNQISQNSSF